MRKLILSAVAAIAAIAGPAVAAPVTQTFNFRAEGAYVCDTDFVCTDTFVSWSASLSYLGEISILVDPADLSSITVQDADFRPLDWRAAASTRVAYDEATDILRIWTNLLPHPSDFRPYFEFEILGYSNTFTNGFASGAKGFYQGENSGSRLFYSPELFLRGDVNVPEPAAFGLLGLGALALAYRRS